MTENIFRNSRGTFTCDDCGQAATVPSLIKHSEDCEGAQMTEPVYTEEDLRIANAIHHSRPTDLIPNDIIRRCELCLAVAAEFAKIRRERDQAAEKMAVALKLLKLACEKADQFEELSDCIDGSLIDGANAALADYERSAR